MSEPQTPFDPRRERVAIPPGRSMLLRVDDYPWKGAVWNSHYEVEIHLIRHSSGIAFIGDHIGEFHPGHLSIIGSNLPHNWVTPNLGNRNLVERDTVLQFDPEKIGSVCRTIPEFGQVLSLLERSARGIEFHGETRLQGQLILEKMSSMTPCQASSALFDLLNLMAESDECRVLASQSYADQLGAESENQLCPITFALDYISERFLESPTQKEVASILNMAPATFSRLFKAKTGSTYTEYLTSLRIYTAQKLLVESDNSITDICYLSGFKNVSNFNRIFLSRVQMSPSAYRSTARKRD